MQTMWIEDDRLRVLDTFDPTPALNLAAKLRSAGATGFGESRLAATIPMELWTAWSREAGLKPNDPAMSAVVARKLNDPDYAHLRVWNGRF